MQLPKRREVLSRSRWQECVFGVIRLATCFILVISGSGMAAASVINESNTAVVINVEDSLSRKVAEYYIKKRHIPDDNIIRIKMRPGRDALSPEEFEAVKNDILKQTRDGIQAYVLVWAKPYRVGCMSITSAVSLGYGDQYCAQGCKPTHRLSYFDSTSKSPLSDHGFRPSMLLVAADFSQARALIDRGTEADYSRARGNVFLLETSDKARSVRSKIYSQIDRVYGEVLPVKIVKQDFIQNKSDVMFYFTGATHVDHLDSIQFVPGAIADHVTSAGGILSGGMQMSSLEWLRAGATGSYGTVVEPCNFPAKFPNPGVIIRHYLNGDTLLEAYWKSVAMPGQGVFIGEPLARPFRGCRVIYKSDGTVLGLVNASNTLPVLRESRRCNL